MRQELRQEQQHSMRRQGNQVLRENGVTCLGMSSTLADVFLTRPRSCGPCGPRLFVTDCNPSISQLFDTKQHSTVSSPDPLSLSLYRFAIPLVIV
ncbi:hypothetical protein LWI29_009611 [Acer saccharum]|uniref:Uncharacterized protein n=1 Tax=Acer saccharum TaxID=4024 RepID=A0AA39SCR1_ACESA|nr:hypothetical protein LWI29_009611 [Acer saccharum]